MMIYMILYLISIMSKYNRTIYVCELKYNFNETLIVLEMIQKIYIYSFTF